MVVPVQRSLHKLQPSLSPDALSPDEVTALRTRISEQAAAERARSLDYQYQAEAEGDDEGVGGRSECKVPRGGWQHAHGLHLTLLHVP